ncbi:hypothetical protein SLA2020_436590 [Shorea laevis]
MVKSQVEKSKTAMSSVKQKLEYKSPNRILPGWGSNKNSNSWISLSGRSLNNTVEVGRLVSDDDIVITEIYLFLESIDLC